MARPKKETIEYFPHYVSGGKTLFILESEFGNDGYAFWFKLLELLGSTNGHVYDTGNSSQMRFLVAKTRVNEEKANKILDLLAELDAIDKELWEKGIIWCQNLIDNVADVYVKRKSDKPKKPILKEFSEQKPHIKEVIEEFSEQKPELNAVSDNINSQSKGKESKEKERKGKERKEGEENTTVLPSISFPTESHKKIYDNTSDVTYKTWFIDTEISETETKVTIKANSDFIKDVLEKKFKDKLHFIFLKEIEII